MWAVYSFLCYSTIYLFYDVGLSCENIGHVCVEGDDGEGGAPFRSLGEQEEADFGCHDEERCISCDIATCSHNWKVV